MAEYRNDAMPPQSACPSKVIQGPADDSHCDFWKHGSIPESRDGRGRKPKARRLRPHGKLNYPNFAQLGRPYRWRKGQPRPTQMVEYGPPQRVCQVEPDEARIAQMAALAAKELALADDRAGELNLDWKTDVIAVLNVDLTQFWNDQEQWKLLKGVAGYEATEQPEEGKCPTCGRPWNKKVQNG